MPTLEIGGKRVQVGDEFLKLGPDERQATVNGIAAQLGLSGPAEETGEGFAPRSVREAEPTREQKQASYREMAKGARERQGPVMAGIDTAVRGIARSVPFMDDIAAYGDYSRPNTVRESYQDALDFQRAQNTVDDTDRPITSYGSQIAGGLALPVGSAAGAATLPQAMKQGLGVGAAYGAAYGAGQGDSIADRAGRAVTGAVTGGGIGLVAPPIIGGVVAGGKAIGGVVAAPIQRMMGNVNADKAAAAKVRDALARDEASGARAMTDAQFAAAQDAGHPVILADQGGKATHDLARSAANTSSEARNALEGVTTERASNAGVRAAEHVEDLGGVTISNAEKREALKAQARKENAPAYQAAYSSPKAQALWDEEFGNFAQAPVVQKAIGESVERSSNAAVRRGEQPARAPFVMDKETGKYLLRRNEDGSVAMPNLEFWDHVQRSLSDLADGAGRSAALDIRGLRQQLLEKLDNVVPEFMKARSGAAAHFGAEGAYELGLTAGKKQTIGDGELAHTLKSLAPSEQQLFKEGFATSFGDTLRGLKDGGNIAKAVYGSDRARNRIDVALGKDAPAFEARMHIELLMDATKREIIGGPTTARQHFHLGDAGSAAIMPLGGAVLGGVSTGDWQAGALAGAALKGGLKRGDRLIAQRVGEMLASGNPQQIENLIKIASRSPKYMDALEAMAKTVVSQSAARAGGNSTVGGRLIGFKPVAASDNPNEQREQGGQAQNQQNPGQLVSQGSAAINALQRRMKGPEPMSRPISMGIRG